MMREDNRFVQDLLWFSLGFWLVICIFVML